MTFESLANAWEISQKGTKLHIISKGHIIEENNFHTKYKNCMYLESQLRASHWMKETWIQMPDSLLPNDVILGKNIQKKNN